MTGFDRVAARSGVALSGSIHKFCDSYNARMGTGEKNVTLVCDGGRAGVKRKVEADAEPAAHNQGAGDGGGAASTGESTQAAMPS